MYIDISPVQINLNVIRMVIKNMAQAYSCNRHLRCAEQNEIQLHLLINKALSLKRA